MYLGLSRLAAAVELAIVCLFATNAGAQDAAAK